MEMLEVALAKAEALLADPHLPGVSQRIVYRGGEGVEVPTRGSVLADRARIIRELEDAAHEAAVGAGKAGPGRDPKGSYRAMQLYPDLAFSIEKRLRSADVAFVLITPLLNYRDWVNFEVAVCARLRTAAIGVRMGETMSANYRIDCAQIIECGHEEVRAVLGAFKEFRPRG